MLRNGTSIALILILAGWLPACPGFGADDHVVSPMELRKAIVDASLARDNNLAAVHGFFSNKSVASALNSARMDPVRIERAVSQLNDEELARLASRTSRIQRDLSAGALNNQQLTYIVIALATAVIILVIVEK
jgi:hypothetical protein